MGINANGKYFLFALKLMAFPNGIGCNEFAFCSIEANINSELSAEFSEDDNCKKFVSLSLTSVKWFPIILEASL
ncbi:hypothetical protein D3C87_1858540 [compost metagenome]